MKIASYNVLSGGFVNYQNKLEKPERMPQLQEAIKTINADVIGLIDTFRWDEVFMADDLRKLFGYTYSHCVNLEDERLRKKGHNNGITVLSNVPGTTFETVWIETRNAVKATVIMDNELIDIYTAYLDDMSEDTRMKQVKAFHKHTGKGRNTVIMGDLNTIYPDDVDMLKSAFTKYLGNAAAYADPSHPVSYMTAVYNELNKANVIPFLKEQGFLDARGVGARIPTFPSPLAKLPVANGLAIDHMFYSGRLAMNNFTVMTGGIFEQASDHYPISAILQST